MEATKSLLTPIKDEGAVTTEIAPSHERVLETFMMEARILGTALACHRVLEKCVKGQFYVKILLPKHKPTYQNPEETIAIGALERGSTNNYEPDDPNWTILVVEDGEHASAFANYLFSVPPDEKTYAKITLSPQGLNSAFSPHFSDQDAKERIARKVELLNDLLTGYPLEDLFLDVMPGEDKGMDSTAVTTQNNVDIQPQSEANIPHVIKSVTEGLENMPPLWHNYEIRRQAQDTVWEYGKAFGPARVLAAYLRRYLPENFPGHVGIAAQPPSYLEGTNGNIPCVKTTGYRSYNPNGVDVIVYHANGEILVQFPCTASGRYDTKVQSACPSEIWETVKKTLQDHEFID